MPTIGLVERLAAHGAVEGGIAVGEDAAVGGHQPVAAAVRRCGHSDHRLVQMQTPGRAVERCVSVGEDATVRGHLPVATVTGRGRHPDHGSVELEGTGRAVELGAAVVEDAAVRCGQPVALARGVRPVVEGAGRGVGTIGTDEARHTAGALARTGNRVELRKCVPGRQGRLRGAPGGAGQLLNERLDAGSRLEGSHGRAGVPDRQEAPTRAAPVELAPVGSGAFVAVGAPLLIDSIRPWATPFVSM